MVVAFKRDVGVRSGRSTSEIESWHAIRLDAWLSTFHFPRSTFPILENSNYPSPPSDFLLLSSLSRGGSIDFRGWDSFRSRNLEDRRSSSVPRIVRDGRGSLLGKVIPARRSTDRYQDEARDQPV